MIIEWDVPLAIVTDSADQYWRMITELTAPVVSVLEKLDEAARQRIAREVIREAAMYQRSGALRIPGLSRCVVGTK